MTPPASVQLPDPVPADLLDEVQSKLQYAAAGTCDLRIDPANAAVVTYRIDRTHQRRVAPEAIADKITRVVRSVVKGHTPPSTETFVDRRDAPIPAGQDPMPWLLQQGHVFQLGTGQYGMGPLVVRLMAYFDHLFGELAAPFGPTEHAFPAMISTRAMARCDYFTSFPHSCCFVHHLQEDVDTISAFADRARQQHGTTPSAGELASTDYMLAPAVCFHWYNHLADSTIPKQGVQAATAVGKCFRFESGNLKSLERLWDFTMRELIFVAPADVVTRHRQSSMAAWKKRMDRLGLAYTIQSATDPFFVAEYQTRTRFQTAFQLKYEIRLTLPYSDGSLAAGSFNYHQDFFGRSFGIDTEAGGPAHTACTAIGLERWAFGFLCQFGPDPSGWPHEVARFVTDGPCASHHSEEGL
ncbi:MAG: hypothetical protein ACE5GE_04485 [Phycisphaerae bacterium]